MKNFTLYTNPKLVSRWPAARSKCYMVREMIQLALDDYKAHGPNKNPPGPAGVYMDSRLPDEMYHQLSSAALECRLPLSAFARCFTERAMAKAGA